MKKMWLLILVICLSLSQSVFANEVTEDYIDMAASCAAEGNYQTALKYINDALYIEPQNQDLLDLKNALYEVTNPNFVSYLSKSLPFVKQVNFAKKAGDKQRVLSILEQNANNGNYWGCYLLADFYKNNDNFYSAINFYQKAINIRPDYVQAYLGLGEAQYELKNYTAAISSFQKYLTSNPNSDYTYAMLAKCQLAQGNSTLALNYIEKALYISNNTEYKLLQGEILYERGYYSQAKDILENLKQNIQTSEIYKYIGLCNYKLQNYPDALLNLDKAIILSDDTGNLNMIYNEVKQKLNRQNAQ